MTQETKFTVARVNALYAPLQNDKGVNYGWIRLDFPPERVDFREASKQLPESLLKRQLARLKDDRLCYMSDTEKQNEDEQELGESRDVWNQFKTMSVKSLAEASDEYFNY